MSDTYIKANPAVKELYKSLAEYFTEPVRTNRVIKKIIKTNEVK